MQYPLMSEYVSAIQDASDNLDELAHLVPVLDDHGEPYRSSGAFAVVFKMKDEQTGKCYALKCFLEEQEGRAEAYRLIADELDCVDSSYVTSVKYLEKEIFVDSSCEEDEFPVLLMDWVEGETMETYIANNYQEEYAMGMLCYRFCKMAAWLRSQPFAHGDIKPDNIIVRPDGTLTLVDYDGMFVPAMKGQKSPNIGTKDFSHPLRTIDDFDETIDDFALASIALSLKAISLKPSLLDEYGAADRLLFSAADYRDWGKSKVMAALQELMNDEELTTLLSMFLLANAKKNLVMCSFRLFVVKKPECRIEVLSTKVTGEDLKNAVIDECGAKYSKDGKRILKLRDFRGSYSIKFRTTIICDDAFSGCNFLTNIVIPNSVTSIGNFAFRGSKSLISIVIPNSVTSIGDGAFFSCASLSSIVIPDSVTSIGLGAFSKCASLSSVVIPNSVTSIGDRVFGVCKSLTSIVIPNSVTSIGDRAFVSCASLSSIVIPDSVTSIGNSAFWHCTSLSSIVIPDSVTSIGDRAFGICTSLISIVIPDSVVKIEGNPFVDWNGELTNLSSMFVYDDDVLFDNKLEKIVAFRRRDVSYFIPESVTSIGNSAFSGCASLSSIEIPDSVASIGDCAFEDCASLSSIVFPNSITSIGDRAFGGCTSLSSLVIPESVTSIGNSAFSGCASLSSIVIPNSVTSIGDWAFGDCTSLSSIVVPDSVTSIGNEAFWGCISLTNIVIPNSVTCIGALAFSGCVSLSSIVIPNSVASIGDSAFGDCASLSSVVIPNSVTSIGHWAFSGCTSLSNIVIPNSVTYIGQRAFYGCNSLPLSTREELISRFGKEVFEDVSN